MISWVKLATCFFYNVIKSFVRQIAGRFMGFTIHDDILMIIIGWLLMSRGTGTAREVGEALIYAAVASLGAAGGLGILQLIAPPQQPQVAAPMAYAAVYPAVVEVS
jgi:hypothetical protein